MKNIIIQLKNKENNKFIMLIKNLPFFNAFVHDKNNIPMYIQTLKFI